MTASRRLLSVTREWPWGLAVLTDPGSSEDLPTQLGESGISAGHAIVMAGIQHAVDGQATAEVWIGSSCDGLICIYDDEFETSCGAVIVSDAGYEEKAPAEIGEGIHRLRVLVDEVGSPTYVVFEFGATS